MSLTIAQLGLLNSDARSRPELEQFIVDGQDNKIADFYNTADGQVKAWRTNMTRNDLFDAMNIAQFDALSAGKRDAWKLMLDQGSVDPSRNRIRAAVIDIWPAAQATNILTAMTENARRIEVLIGGAAVADGGVTALRRTFSGSISDAEVALALRG